MVGAVDTRIRIGVLATGYKGAKLVRRLPWRYDVDLDFVVTYDDKADFNGRQWPQSIKETCNRFEIDLYESKSITKDIRERMKSVDFVFVIGWQFLLPTDIINLVILHDSALPKVRGFAPTVTSLLNGLPIGASALVPVKEADMGPVYAVISDSHSSHALYDDLQQAFDRIVKYYDELITKVIRGAIPQEQDHSQATYSIWRDEEDFRIKWDNSVERVSNFIRFTGFPYMGATSFYDGKKIYIRGCDIVKDQKSFVEYHPGKIWSISGGSAEVMCNDGLLRIYNVVDASNAPVEFNKMRCRL